MAWNAPTHSTCSMGSPWWKALRARCGLISSCAPISGPNEISPKPDDPARGFVSAADLYRVYLRPASRARGFGFLRRRAVCAFGGGESRLALGSARLAQEARV